jgi:archaellum component FlaD/FlaE
LFPLVAISLLKSGQRSSQSERMGRGENTGQDEKECAGDNKRTQHSGPNDENGRNGEMKNRAPERRGDENQEQGRERNERTGQQGQRSRQNERSGQNERRSTNARENTGNAPAKVNVTTQQRTEIRTRLVAHSSARKLSRSNIHFSLSVGTRVPRRVHFYELPADIVAIVPEYRGFRDIRVGNEIVIIDPATFEIVTVIT